MKYIHLLACLCFAAQNFAAPPVEERVKTMLQRMTLEEKTAQMQDLSFGDLAGATVHQRLKGISPGCVNTAAKQSLAEIAVAIKEVSEYVRNNTRLGIPPFFVAEALHGVAHKGGTIFPQAIALGSTFNPELVERVAEHIASQCKAAGITQVLSPDLDLARELRWGRVEETYGEDPYLVGRMGVAYIKAFNRHKIICTPKHYVAHGTPTNGLNLSSVAGGDRELYSVYLKPFADVVRETNPYSIMNAYSSYDGEPITSSRRLMTDILRGELGFKGYVSSDWGSVGMLRTFHAAAEDDAEAARQAVRAGIDCEVASDCYAHLNELVAKGALTENDIDVCVGRILTAKFEMGIITDDGGTAAHGNAGVSPALPNVESVDVSSAQLALEAAREAVVLLKNDGALLPLNKEKLKSIAVIGPNAARTQFGDYTWTDDGAYGVSPLQGIQTLVGQSVKINYAKGCEIWKRDRTGIAEAVRAAAESDVAIVFGGTASAWPGLRNGEAVSGESYDLSALALPGVQQELLEAVAATGKPVVFVLVTGKPLAITWAKEHLPAIMVQWYGGEQQGNAVAEILFGLTNPSGRLNVSFPQSVGHLPVYYNYFKTDRGSFYKRRGTPDSQGLDYVFSDPSPLWAFGAGMSYTTFEYKDMRLNAESFTIDRTIVVDVDVTNTGDRDGKEVVQLYVSDVVSSVATPVRELKRFAKVNIPKGETRTVRFELPVSELALYDSSMQRRVEPGEFLLQTAPSSDNILLNKTIHVAE